MTEENEGQYDVEEMEPDEVEAIAKRMGHTPRENFKGDPEKWLEPKDFVARALNEFPLLKANLRTVNRRFDEMEKKLGNKIEKQAEVLKEFNKHHQTTLAKTAQQEYQRGLEEAQARLTQAVEDGDVKEAEAAFKDAQELMKKTPKEPDTKGDDDDAAERQRQGQEALKDWEKENTWYKDDRRMRKFAFECGELLAKTEPNLTAKEQLAAILEMTKEEFPDHFSNPARKRAGSVENGGHSKTVGSKGAKKGYNDLPREAKVLCDDFCNPVTGIPGFTKEQYLAEYNGPWRE